MVVPSHDVQEVGGKVRFKKYYFFYLEDNYNIVMVFAIHQHESAIGIHVPPTSSCAFLLPSSPPYPSGMSQSTSFGHPDSCIELALVIYFTYDNIHVSVLSLKSPYSRLLPLCTKICSICLCLFCCPACKVIGTIFLNSTYLN